MALKLFEASSGAVLRIYVNFVLSPTKD